MAREHGINEMTIRSWLERDTEGGAAQMLEMSRLRRENEALLRLVGQLTYESEIRKKIDAVSDAERGSKSRLAQELGVSRSSLYCSASPEREQF